ncbi:MAG: hypothetical protein KGI90_12240 [Burkholderiales bacterium]|nr:hypothetical protein [Burkholderiales bacterium]
MLFRRSRSLTFLPYGRRRSRWRPPGWFWLLLFSAAAGAGGVLWVQQRYLPPRLSAEASTQLRGAYAQADAERLRLRQALAQATQQLAGARTEVQSLTQALDASHATATRLQGDLAAAVDALPPDPRAGAVAVRAAQFTAGGGRLGYEVVLSTARVAAGQAQPALLSLTVTGQAASGRDGSVALAPVALALGRQTVARGSLPLPAGFRPRQTTVQVLEHAGGPVLGARTLRVP